MTETPLFFVLDQGTQSTRAMLFDLNGQLVAKSQLHIEPYESPNAGEAEQDTGYFWRKIGQACEQLWAEHESLKSQVVGVSIAVQRASVVCLDANKNPLRPAIIWLDQRRAEAPPNTPWWLQTGSSLVGQHGVLHQFKTKAECNWIAEQEPEVWKNTAHYVLLSGYLIYKLTGRLCDSVASQVGYLPFDFKQQTWCKPSHWAWKVLRVKQEQLPELVKPGEKIGFLTPEASQTLGLDQTIPVYAAGADKACEVIGSGAYHAHTANVSYGTTATLNTSHARFVTPQPMVPPYPAAIPNRYNTEVAVQRGYWMVNWFKNEFAYEQVEKARKLDQPAEVLFERFLEETPPGALGLTLQPFWNPGVRFPGPEAKGAIIGFGEAHTKAHVYRAIIEGVCYALIAGTEILEKRQKQKIKELRITGGGSQSDAIMQISADMFGLPAVRIHINEATGLGAAINIAVGAGYFNNYQAATKAMTHVRDTFLPNAESHQLYQQLFKQVYQELYPKLGPLYKRIRAITGYPKR
ncbi:MAG TPA: FGGY-family carbohydrate kinase [Alcanivoracaceae bacterium]|nr:FGGY-family carbohydrate kinase [Alcanivoracaceae bacterium]